MISFSSLKVSTTSLVSREDLQKIVLQYECSVTAHLLLSVYKGADAIVEKDLSHYKLYRSEQAGFEPSDATFVADVLPEEYVVGRYEDTELKEHAYYYYRVCAVNTDGVCGPMSEEFSACTREMLYDMQGDMQA